MANSKSSGNNYEYATVDTAPESDAEGYFTNEVDVRKLSNNKNVHHIFFSVREAADNWSLDASVITVKLQFMCPGDNRWQKYANGGSDFAIGDRVMIEDTGAKVLWRAGVHYDDYTSGSLIFGFDW
jgi:hypothetical protein